MFRGASQVLKSRAPVLHRFLKGAVRRSPVPTIKLLNGKWTLAAPHLLTAEPTEPHILRWIDLILRPGDTFFDVGAHYGWISLAACHRVGAVGKIVAFEPSPPLVKILEYHKKVNRFRQMTIVRKAVSDSDDQPVTFYLRNEGDSFMNSLVDHPAEPSAYPRESTIQVHSVSLDRFCKENSVYPALVKIDVEGAELLVLQGSKRLLDQRRPAFLIAVHPGWLPPGQSPAQIFDLFRTHRYKLVQSVVINYNGANFGDYLFVPEAETQAIE
jgi:FkbM family methyltransferase